MSNAVQWRRTPKARGAVRLDRAVRELLDEQITPRQDKFSQLAEAWSRLLPAVLSRHCEIADITRGQLDVQVDSPSYLYELQLCSSELLEELQLRCPKVRLTKIKFFVA